MVKAVVLNRLLIHSAVVFFQPGTGKKADNTNCHRKNIENQTTGLVSGVYLVHIFQKDRNSKIAKILISNNQQ